MQGPTTHVSFIELENFKTFQGIHRASFHPKVNIITGVNGSGKTCLIEAICFGLGFSNLSGLRCNQWTDLISNAINEKTGQFDASFTRVHLRLINAEFHELPSSSSKIRRNMNQPQLTEIEASVDRKTKSRHFKLNNKHQSIKELRKYLRLNCGINTETSLWFIPQQDVHKMALSSPVDLAKCLCEASGTNLLMDNIKQAEKSGLQFQSLATEIGKNIQHLNQMITNETKELQNANEASKLSSRFNQHQKELSHLKHQQQRANIQFTKQHAHEIKQDLDKLKLALLNDQNQITQVTENIHSLSNQVESKSKAFESLQEKLEQQIVALSSEKQVYESMIQKEQKKLKECEKAKLKSLQALEQNKKKEQISKTLENQQYAIHFIDSELQRVQPRDQKALKILLNDIENKMTSPTNAFQAIHDREEKLLEKIKLAKFQYELLSSQTSDLETSLYALGHVCEFGCQKIYDSTKRTFETKDMNLGLKIEEIELSLGYFQQASIRPPSGDLGQLMELITIRSSNPQDESSLPSSTVPFNESAEQEWLNPLGFLLYPHLRKRVCTSVAAAKELLLFQERQPERNQKLIIWPLDSISIPTHSKSKKGDKTNEKNRKELIDELLHRYGPNQICNPMDWIVPKLKRDATSTTVKAVDVTKCIEKACGGFLLVHSDELGQEILKQYQIPTITKSLNVHRHGVVSGGSSHHQTSIETLSRQEQFLRKLILLDEMQSQRQHLVDQFQKSTTAFQVCLTYQQLKERIMKSRSQVQQALDHTTWLESCHANLCKEKQVFTSNNERMDHSKALRELYQQISSHFEQAKATPRDFSLHLAVQEFLQHALRESRNHRNALPERMDVLDQQQHMHTMTSQVDQMKIQVEKKKQHQHDLSRQIMDCKTKQEQNRASLATCDDQTLELKRLETKRQYLETKRATSNSKVKCCMDHYAQVSKSLGSLVRTSTGDDDSVEDSKDPVEDLENLKLKVARLKDRIEEKEKTCQTLELQYRVVEQQSSGSRAVSSSRSSSRSRPEPRQQSQMKKKDDDLLTIRMKESNLRSKYENVTEFEEHFQRVQYAMERLKEGIVSCEIQMKMANERALEDISTNFERLFHILVPSMEGRLVKVGEAKDSSTSGLMQCRFDIFHATTTIGDTLATTERLGRPIEQLSGGQLTLLGLAYIFALAMWNSGRVYCFDEVDAALDEQKQVLVAQLLHKSFPSAQMMCITHHQALKHLAQHQIVVQKTKEMGSSTIRCVTLRSSP